MEKRSRGVAFSFLAFRYTYRLRYLLFSKIRQLTAEK